MAALLFSIADIALFIGKKDDWLRNLINFHPEDPVAEAYLRGKLRTKIMLRFDSLNYALHGSPQAVNEMKEYLSEQQINENA